MDIPQLIEEMQIAASDVLNKDVTSLRGFSQRQLKAIAQQAEIVATGIATGGITEETREFFLDGLEDMVLSFVNTLRGLLTITIEKVWNAVVGVLWKAISAVTNIALPEPIMD